MRRTYGYLRQGVGYGYNKVKGRGALLAIVSTSAGSCGPVVVGHRLRKGPVNSARGAGKFLADAIAATRRTGHAAAVICDRMDSAFYTHRVVAAALAAGAWFSITARMDPAITAAINLIPDDAWVPIKYPQAIFDEEQQRWIWRRVGRRNHLHRVHLQTAETPGHRPAHRPTGETPQPRRRPARARGTARVGLLHHRPVPQPSQGQ